MKSTRPLVERSAFWLSERAGSDERVAELDSHLADSIVHGQGVAFADVLSLVGLVLRFKAKSLPREVGKCLVVAPIAFFQLVLLGFTYETHFPAWDFTAHEETVWTSEALMWSRVVDVLFVMSIVFALWAARRAVRSVMAGRLVLPAAFVALFVIAATQMDRFVDRADWYRDHEQIYYALTAEHVNIIQPYSIALFTAFAALPLLYIAADFAAVRRTIS